jgi:hypothetical protein
MNSRILSLCAVAILASTAMAADKEKPSASGQVSRAEMGKQAAADEVREECVGHCNRTERRCSADVRRARADCSRNAANAGRDAYGNACTARYQHRYGVCVDAMYNIAAMRFDCIKTERDAMSFCRDELRDCTAACR